MISISRLLCDLDSYGETLRYGRAAAPAARAPVVVWNSTGRCNLSCLHCYSDSTNCPSGKELDTGEAKAMISHFAELKVPALLFSGGEPLLREDIFELSRHAAANGLHAVLSTNGTLVTRILAKEIADAGFDYAGISIDGLEETHDRFRASPGAFRLALSGIRNLVKAGQKVGVRFTVTRRNFGDLRGVLKLVEDEGIRRICVYHLVYAGRGRSLMNEDITHGEARALMDLLIEWTLSMRDKGVPREVLTVDNHADAAYLYLRLKKESPARAERAREMLRRNGGNGSGVTIACVDSTGNVHPDQFWRKHSLGNVRERPFGAIWADLSNGLMAALKDRRAFLKGRCARCTFVDMCNGNFRARAEAVFGDMWTEDPACYLTDEEIGSSRHP